AAHHDEAAFGHVVVNSVALEIVADHGVFRHAHVLVEDGAADFGAAADVAVVEDHALVHFRAGVHQHAAAEHGIADGATREDAAAGDDAVDRLSAAVLLVE